MRYRSRALVGSGWPRSFVVVAAILLVWVCDAFAAPPSAIDKDAARTSLEQGDERMRSKDYKGALEAYQRADDIMGVPTTSIEVGKAALALGRLVIAYGALKRTADYPKKQGEPPPFTKARKEARRLAKKVKPRIPRLLIEVVGHGPEVDVEVIVDEEPIDAWGRAVGIDPGSHVVTATAPGFQSAEEQIVLQEGERRTLSLTLVATKTDLPGPVDTSSGDAWWTVALVSLPIAGASLAAGAVTGALSLTQVASVKEQCDGNRCPPAVQDKLSTAQTLAHVSTVTLIAGGVGAALGIAAITIAISTGADDEGQQEEAWVTVGPTGVALTISF